MKKNTHGGLVNVWWWCTRVKSKKSAVTHPSIIIDYSVRRCKTPQLSNQRYFLSERHTFCPEDDAILYHGPRVICPLSHPLIPTTSWDSDKSWKKNNNLQPSFLRLPFFIPLGPWVYVIGISTCTFKCSAWKRIGKIYRRPMVPMGQFWDVFQPFRSFFACTVKCNM